MLNEVMLYVGAGIITIWGIAHIVATKAIVDGFGAISGDNKKIITMEAMAEGLTLCFIGVLVFLITIFTGIQNEAARIIYPACAVMLLIMAVLTLATGARTSILPYKICPVIKTIVAVLFFLGATL